MSSVPANGSNGSAALAPAVMADTKGKDLLLAEGVTMRFGGLVAVNSVDFNIPLGSIVSLIGPNGAGKTTFFNTITGLYKPTSGRLLFNGHDITKRSPWEVMELGIARTFQNIRLFANMTALENVLVGQHCRMKSGVLASVLRLQTMVKEELSAREKALHLLKIVDLTANWMSLPRTCPMATRGDSKLPVLSAATPSCFCWTSLRRA